MMMRKKMIMAPEDNSAKKRSWGSPARRILAGGILVAALAGGVFSVGRALATAAARPTPKGRTVAVAGVPDVAPVAPTDASASAPIYRNGTLLNLPASLREGKAWVPLRALMEALGYAVTWDQSAANVQLSSPGTTGVGVTVPGAGVELVGSYRFADAAGFYRIVGEVRNAGKNPAYGPRVTAIIRDAAGKLIDTVSAPVYLDTVPPGGKAPFSLASPVKAADVWTVELRIDTQTRYVEQNGRTPKQPKLVNLALARFAAPDGVLTYSGTVTNAGPGTAKELRVVLTGYNAAGTPVAVETAFTSPGDLAPGAKVNYDVPVTANAPIVSSATVQFEWK